MSKFKNKPKGTVGVKFTVPSFRSGGVEYLSAEVEEAANAGNEEALNLIKKLIEKGASCIEVIEPKKGNKKKEVEPENPEPEEDTEEEKGVEDE